MSLYEIFEKGSDLSKNDIISLLTLSETDDISKLSQKALAVKKNKWGNKINLSAVLKFSNFCEDNCLFCGAREENFSLARYRMAPDEILDAAKHISNLGFKSIVLQSGKDSFYDTDIIAYIIYKIKKEMDLSVSLTLRERGFDEYKTWKLAGAERYILNHEISSPELFVQYHQKKIISNRQNLFNYLKSINLSIGTGTIVGLPDQKIEDIADDLLLFSENETDLVAITPFLAVPFTPYQNRTNCNNNILKKTLAVTRLIMPNTNIPITASLDLVNGNGIEDAVLTGANFALVSFTPNKYHGKFVATANNSPILSAEWDNFVKLRSRLEESGVVISTDAKV